jgi:hypothetical protein
VKKLKLLGLNWLFWIPHKQGKMKNERSLLAEKILNLKKLRAKEIKF